MFDNFELISRLHDKVSEFETQYVQNIASYFTSGLAGYNNLQYFVAQSQNKTLELPGPSNLEYFSSEVKQKLPDLLNEFQPYLTTYNQFYEELLTLLTKHDPYYRTTLDMSRDELKSEYGNCVLEFSAWPQNAIIYFQYHEPITFEPEYKVEELKALDAELQQLYKSVIETIAERHSELIQSYSNGDFQEAKA
ncbi:hypothetical protein GCM10009128_26380 [Psychrosphaera haliotis]|uniref:hypothetical protein n=1 Tax=Psychrosphaera haliotis TaxID=555083 RepID=UPI0031D70CF1